jgi:hypothetical protein
MSYRFTIQASSPRALKEFDPNDTNLSDAIQTVFPLETECAILVWNWVYVPLSYKYDFSMMIDDVIALIDAMQVEPSGRRTIQWPSNTFACTWKVEWDARVTTVEADWVSVVGNTEAMLAAVPKIVVESSGFVEEWKRPLEAIWGGLTSAGYTSKLLGLDHLMATVSKIGRCGILYRE